MFQIITFLKVPFRGFRGWFMLFQILQFVLSLLPDNQYHRSRSINKLFYIKIAEKVSFCHFFSVLTIKNDRIYKKITLQKN